MCVGVCPSMRARVHACVQAKIPLAFTSMPSCLMQPILLMIRVPRLFGGPKHHPPAIREYNTLVSQRAHMHISGCCGIAHKRSINFARCTSHGPHRKIALGRSRITRRWMYIFTLRGCSSSSRSSWVVAGQGRLSCLASRNPILYGSVFLVGGRSLAERKCVLTSFAGESIVENIGDFIIARNLIASDFVQWMGLCIFWILHQACTQDFGKGGFQSGTSRVLSGNFLII